MTQKEIAEFAGVDVRTVQNWVAAVPPENFSGGYQSRVAQAKQSNEPLQYTRQEVEAILLTGLRPGMARDILIQKLHETGDYLPVPGDYPVQKEPKAVIVARALLLASEIIEERKAVIAELAPKAEVYDLLANAKNDRAIGDVAKILGTGERKMFAALRRDKILRPDNLPYQQFLDHGYFRVVAKPIKKNGFVDSYLQTYVTAKGMEYLARRYGPKPPLLAA